jgi:hypothetical protein
VTDLQKQLDEARKMIADRDIFIARYGLGAVIVIAILAWQLLRAYRYVE